MGVRMEGDVVEGAVGMGWRDVVEGNGLEWDGVVWRDAYIYIYILYY